MNKFTFGILFIIVLGTTPMVFADAETDAKLEFAGALEETLGHFWALELNLDESNTELAVVHATHPISELYDTMSTHLETNLEFDEKLQQTLLELKDKASTSVTRNDAQSAIEDAKEVIQEARDMVIGEDLSNDSAFKAQLINGLLETSKVEYKEAIENGEIVEMAEFQDGSAFIWRSQQIFEEIRSDVSNSGKVNDTFVKILEAYEQRSAPEQVSVLVDELISEFEILSGVESKESSHMEEVFGEGTSIVVDLEESLSMTSGEEKQKDVDLEESLSIDTEQPKQKDTTSLPPLKQIKEGINPENIQCKSSMELIFKVSGEPACVKASSVQKLVSWGWTQ